MRWQDDEIFCAWLTEHRYAVQTDKGLRPNLSQGAILYMYESYQAGRGLADGTPAVLKCVADELDKRASLRRSCGESRMSAETGADVAAAIRTVINL